MIKKLILLSIFVVGFCAAINAFSEGASQKVMPKKVKKDTNFDGKVDQTEVYDASGNIVRVESDTTGDGKIDKWVSYLEGKPVKSKRDTNGDGKPDVWSDY